MQIKDKNVYNEFSENAQNVALASTFCHIIPVDLVIVLLV